MADSQIKTTIDSLLDFVRSEGKTNINTIAAKLGVSTAIVENWVKILEKSGMVKVTYELGRMYVSPGASQTESRILENKINVQEEILDTEFDSKMLELNKLSKMISNLNTSLVRSNKVYIEKFPEIQKKLTEINTIYEQMKKENTLTMGMKANLEKVYDDINKNVSELVGKIKYLDSQEIGELIDIVKEERNAMEKAKEEMKVVRNMRAESAKWSEEVMKEFDKTIAESRAKLLKERNDVKLQLAEEEKELSQISNTLSKSLQMAKSLLSQVDSFNRSKKRKKEDLDKVVKDFTDRYTKSYTAMSKGISMLGDKSSGLEHEIGVVKASFGDMSDIYDLLHEIQNGIGSSQKEIEELKKEIESLRSEMTKLKTKSASAQETESGIRSVSERANEMEGRVSGFRKNLKDILQKISFEGSGKESEAEPAIGTEVPAGEGVSQPVKGDTAETAQAQPGQEGAREEPAVPATDGQEDAPKAGDDGEKKEVE